MKFNSRDWRLHHVDQRVNASSSTASAASPLWNAAVVGVASMLAGWLLLSRYRYGWPSKELASTVSTIVGCLAIAGPFVLFRRGSEEQGVGDLSWMASGLLILTFDLASTVRGASGSHNWINPLEPRTMALIVLAFTLAGWHQRRGEPIWTWTNVIGWIQTCGWLAAGLLAATGGSMFSGFLVR